jgi:hypothetical protein
MTPTVPARLCDRETHGVAFPYFIVPGRKTIKENQNQPQLRSKAESGKARPETEHFLPDPPTR